MVKKNRTWLALFIAFCFVIGTVPARALDRDDHRCEERIHKAEANLEKAIHKHGEHSRQAEKRRHDLEEVRERCHHDHDRDHDHDGHR